MKTLKSEQNQENNSNESSFWKKRLLLIFFGLLALSILSHFIINDRWIKIITNHLGGLGIIGLFACLAAFIAKRKGYNYWKVFKLSLSLPVLIGLIAVLIVSLKINFLYCGGGFSLLSSLLLVIIFLVFKRKKIIIVSE